MQEYSTLNNVIGVVVIGRNEGERLVNCLQSLTPMTAAIVYVDSGSTDMSVANAKQLGVFVLNLDMTQPFTAARARNAGFAELIKKCPALSFVQFVDGDCEVVSTWLARASAFLQNHTEVAIVCGRRRERFPEHSLYNYQCDVEWNTPVGEAKACGGDFLCRAQVYADVGGFNPRLIAGEEPELCIRIRQKGWKIVRLEEEMTLHDAAMLHFKQWWKRSVRAGHAFAEGASLHGGLPERHYVKETFRALVWGAILPLMFLLLCFISKWALVGLIVLYGLQWIRLAKRLNRLDKNWHLAGLLVLAKFAEFSGGLVFWKNRFLNRQGRLIEYK